MSTDQRQQTGVVEATPEPATKRQPFSTVGIALGAFALLLSILPMFVLPMLYPPPPLEEQAVGVLKRLKDRAVSSVKGEKYEAALSARTKEKSLYRLFDLAAAVAGASAIIVGALGFARQEAWRRCAAGMGLGAAAIAMQYVFGVAALLVLITIVGGFLF